MNLLVNTVRKVELTRQVVLISFVLLLLLLLLERTLLVLPLFLFVKGIWQRDWRTHIWLCFALLFYFLVVINQLAQTPTAWLAWMQCGIIVILFSGALFYCRWAKLLYLPVDAAAQGTP